jgi:8-oxo-dGTP pyrophosphatase MutT (NUDIX family)
MNDLPRRDKVLAYVTRGDALLVFAQPASPSAGEQVPAGTIEPGEDPMHAVMREIREETGLERISTPALLAIHECDLRPWKDELHIRHVFHVVVRGVVADTWSHWERHASDGSEAIEFRFRWVDAFDESIELAGFQGAMLPLLRKRLVTRGGG